VLAVAECGKTRIRGSSEPGTGWAAYYLVDASLPAPKKKKRGLRAGRNKIPSKSDLPEGTGSMGTLTCH